MRLLGKKEITFAWYTNVISYVAEKELCHPYAQLRTNPHKLLILLQNTALAYSLFTGTGFLFIIKYLIYQT